MKTVLRVVGTLYLVLLLIVGGSTGIPKLLPHGPELMYTSYDFGGKSYVYILEVYSVVSQNMAGSARLLLGSALHSPSWSPDGNQIAFVESSNHITRIDLISWDNARYIEGVFTSEYGSGISHLIWSPDGSKIAFATSSCCYDYNGGIYVVKADGSDPVRVGAGDDPDWSPDGKQIIFVTNYWGFHDDGNETSGIDIVDVETKSVRSLVVHRNVSYARWSPNGSLIVYGAFEFGVDRMTSSIYTIRPDGTQEHKISPVDAKDWCPSWSPDGKQIAFIDWDNPNSLMIMDADGAHRRSIAELSINSYLVWSPDGEWIATISQYKIYAIHVRDGKIVQLTGEGNYSSLSWRPES